MKRLRGLGECVWVLQLGPAVKRYSNAVTPKWAAIIAVLHFRVLQQTRIHLYICRMASQHDNLHKWQQQFFERMEHPEQLLDLFDCIPGVCMYTKDLESRFVRTNRVFQKLVGASDQSELIGRTDFDFFPPAIASQYVAEDKRVISHGSLVDQVWMVPEQSGVPRLYFCSKRQLHDGEGQVIGVAAVKRPFEYAGDKSAHLGRLVKVMAFVTDHYQQSITVTDMANQVSLSASQLQREFSKYFGITPIRYLREVRIGVARRLLESSELDMVEISAQCGFYDQSHFSRHFKSTTGLSPLKYRSRFRSRESNN